MINLKKKFIFGNIVLLNFVNLTDSEKEMIRFWRNNEKIRQWMYSDHLISRKEHFKFINDLNFANKDFCWLVKQKDTGEYTGVICLNRLNKINRSTYLGIYTNPRLHLAGLGKTLINCLLILAFSKANLHTIKLEVLKNNKHAIKFYEKRGFTTEGCLRDFALKKGKWVDVIIMGLINKKNKV